jgi:transcriptional regulator with XRE-family HTH domain
MSNGDEDDAHAEGHAPGERLRRLRRWRGMEQAALANLVGRSQSWLSKVESGATPLLRTVDIEALANVLQVHPDELTGRPHRSSGGKPSHDVDVMVPAIRRALVDVVPDGRPVPVAELSRRVQTAIASMWRTGSMGELAAQLPALLRAVRLAAESGGGEDDHARALQLLAVTTSTAFPLLKHCGHVDLALLTEKMCASAAADLDDPVWRAYAGIRRSHSLIPVNAPDRALVISREAADLVEPHVGSNDAARRVYGFAHLVSAVWAAQSYLADDAEQHLREAERTAATVPDGDFWDLFFGPMNAAIHRTQVAATLGRGDELPTLAAGIDETAVPGAVQRCYLHTNIALGLAQVRGRADDAVRELRVAEEIAPMRLRTRSAIVPGLVMQLLGKPMRASSLRELRGLAYRVGIGA